jgi:hypothetical protein
MSAIVDILTDLKPFSGGRAGSICSLSVSAVGDMPLTYKWYKNSAEIAGKTSNLIAFLPLAMQDSGIYHCEITDAFSRTVSSKKTRLMVKNQNAPDAPQHVQITGTDGASVQVVWSAVLGAQAYKVYSDTAAYTNTPASVDAADTLVLMPRPARRCIIWVVSVKDGYESMPSEVVDWVPELGILYPPLNLRAVRITDSTVLVSWHKVDSAAGYYLLRNTHADLPGWIAADTATDTFSLNKAFLDAYYYRVISFNATQQSDTTKSVGITAP